jgi:hypothetical protein
MPNAESITAIGKHADADAVSKPQGHSRGRKQAKGKTKRKQPHQQSAAELAPSSELPDPLQITDTALLNYVQVNQTEMNILCAAGVT